MTHTRSPNFTQDGFTALIWACTYGDSTMVKLLVDHGATIDHREKVKILNMYLHTL